MAGQKQPTALKMIRGSEARYINENEPKPQQLAVEPTGQLSAEARREWDRLVPDLVTTGLATGWDVEALMEMCETVATLRECRALLSENGRVFEQEFWSSGVPYTKLAINPCWKLYCDAVRQYKVWAARFGLTPSDRANISVNAPKKRDPGADLLSG